MAAFLVYLVLFLAYGRLLRNAANFWPDKKDKLGDRPIRFSPYFWLACMLILVCLAGFAAQERWIRSHDHAGYYLGSVYVARDMVPNLLNGGLDYLLHTIEHEEYNATVCFLVGPLLRMAGVDIPTYTVVLGLLGVLPLGLLAVGFWRRRVLAEALPDWLGYAAGALMLAMPILYLPLVQGMADVVVLPFAAVALLGGIRLLGLAEQPTPGRKRPAGLVLGVFFCLFALPILRRYFGIFSAAWFPAMGLGLLALALGKQITVKKMVYGWLGLGGLGLLLLGAWYLAFPGFFHNTFVKQYADVYQAYRMGTLADDLGWLWRQFGPFQWSLALAGALALAWIPGLRTMGLFLLLSLGLTVVGVLRIQSFSPQHYYLATAQLGLLAGAGVYAPAYLLARSRKRLGRVLALSLAGVGVVLLFVHTPWAALAPDPAQKLDALASSVYLYPRVRPDLPSIRRVADDIERLNPDGKLAVYIAGSGGDFNDDIFRNMAMPDLAVGVKGLLPSRSHVHVDRRDPFPVDFLTADLVLVPVPMQYHLNPKDQRLAAWVQQAVTDTAGLGRHFEKLSDYPMQNGYQAVLFRRTSPMPVADIRASLADIARDYAEYPAMTAIPDKPATEIASLPGDGPYGLANLSLDATWIEMHPGKTTASRLKLSFGKTGSLSLLPRFDTPCPTGAAVYLAVYAGHRLQDSVLLEGANIPTLRAFQTQPDSAVEIRLYPGPKEDFCDRVVFSYQIR